MPKTISIIATNIRPTGISFSSDLKSLLSGSLFEIENDPAITNEPPDSARILKASVQPPNEVVLLAICNGI